MMAALAFYHLTRSSADEALPMLLQKTLQADKRALVCCQSQQKAQISSAVWSFGEASWMPHGIEGKDDDDAELCPIWICDNPSNNANNSQFVFFVNGITPQSFDDKERVFVLFDGNDTGALEAARRQWKDLRDAGHDLSYWQQDDAGRWSQSA